MSIEQVARGLVELCRAGKHVEAVDTYYSPRIRSVEPVGNEQMPAVMEGIEAVRGKNVWWLENHEVHRAETSGPFVGDGQFAVHYAFEVTNKPTGRRMAMTEMALYTVEGDKIVQEEFFYNMG